MPRNSLLYFALLLFCSLTLWQCRPTEEFDKQILYADLYVRYLESQRELMGQASFYEGDSSQVNNPTPVEFPGGVAFMGSGTEFSSLPGMVNRYSGTLRTDYVTPLRFSFKPSPDAEVMELQLEMAPITDFTATQASLENGLRMTLEGPVEDGETLLLFFTGPDQQPHTIERIGPIERGELFVPATALTDLQAGPHQLYLVKKKQQRVKNGSVVTISAVEYYTREKEVVFE